MTHCLVTDDEAFGTAGQRRSYQGRIVGIGNACEKFGWRRQDRRVCLDQGKAGLRRVGRNPHLGGEDAPQLCKQTIAGQRFMSGQHRFEDFRTQSPSRKCACQHINVEENLHEMSRNTYSSVR